MLDVLYANAWHHRADSASGFVALVGVGGATFGFPVLDPVGGLLVSGMIVQVFSFHSYYSILVILLFF
jgi:divalent metal cation (Fe/Co/Zn/Cd) transporter